MNTSILSDCPWVVPCESAHGGLRRASEAGIRHNSHVPPPQHARTHHTCTLTMFMGVVMMMLCAVSASMPCTEKDYKTDYQPTPHVGHFRYSLPM